MHWQLILGGGICPGLLPFGSRLPVSRSPPTQPFRTRAPEQKPDSDHPACGRPLNRSNGVPGISTEPEPVFP